MANDKTEKATPKRREQSRKRGQVARSPEVNVAVGLLATFGLLAVVGGSTLQAMRDLMAGALSEAGETSGITFSEAWDIGLQGVWDAAKMLAPFLAVGAIAGVLASAAQVRPKITIEVLKPRFSVLNPITGMKKFVSPRSVVGLVKDLLKVSLIGVLAYAMIKSRMFDIIGLTGAGPGEVIALVGDIVLKLGFAIAGVYAVIAVGDFIFQRWQHERDIRMTKDEVKREAKDQDISPHIKGAMKQKQRECVKFGNLVMEGRDIGTNIFPETDFKFYLDAHLEERSKRRAAEGVNENLAARDQRDSQRAVAPLMIPLGARVINNSNMTSQETSSLIISEIRRRLVTQASAH